VWTIGSIGNGASATLQITATVNTASAIVDRSVKTAQGESDPDPSDNSASVGLNAGSLADVQLHETVDDSSPSAGQSVTFTLTVRNAGPSGATSVVVNDVLPAGLTYVSDTSGGSYNSGTGAWTVGSLASGGSSTIQITATATVSTPITNVATKTQTESDPDASNDFASATLNGGTGADLSLDKSASPAPAPPGSVVSFVITASNQGPADATNAIVTDALPAGLTFLAATTSQGSCSGTTTITCSFGTIAAGSSATVTISATKTAGGIISNTASIVADQTDPFLANNSNNATATPVELLHFRVE
jgi:uncharacterized repeat protein (TIGR01451 family)